MRKQLWLVVIVIIFCNNYSIYSNIYPEKHCSYNKVFMQRIISIKDIILFKKYKNEDIHDYLILNNWILVSDDTSREGGSFAPHQKQVTTYKNDYYDINLSIITKSFYTDKNRDALAYIQKIVEVTTESPNEYKMMLSDLYKNSFKIDGEELILAGSEYFGSTGKEIVAKMKKGYTPTIYTVKKYTNGIDKVRLYRQTYEKYDKNMNVMKRYKYILEVDNGKIKLK